MEGLTIDNNNNDNIPKALGKSIETSEKLQEKFSPILEQEKKMQQLVEGVNIPKFEVSLILTKNFLFLNFSIQQPLVAKKQK